MNDTTLQIRISKFVKGMVKLRADQFGFEMSEYLRVLLFADLIHAGLLDMYVASALPIFPLPTDNSERQ